MPLYIEFRRQCDYYDAKIDLQVYNILLWMKLNMAAVMAIILHVNYIIYTTILLVRQN